MEVCFLASGERVAVFDADEFEGKSAKTLKQTLAARIGNSRFRQRLFLEGDSREIPDDEVFASVPAKVQLVVLEFLPPDAAEDESMIRASRQNNQHALSQLLQCPRDPNVKDTLGRTPLFIAAEEGHVEVARLLLEAGAAPDLAGEDGRTPLLMAMLRNHRGVVQLLLECGANVRITWDVANRLGSKIAIYVTVYLKDLHQELRFDPLHDLAMTYPK